MSLIKEFYDANPFPGEYTWKQIMNFAHPPKNRYLAVIDRYLEDNKNILDVGCGTGLITNLFATRYKSKFLGVDFSRGIDIAERFAQINHITNVKFIKEDFYEFYPEDQFDIVIAQSFLTHVTDSATAIKKLKSHLKPKGILIFSIYNPAGQFLKKLYNINYNNTRLELDQLHNPINNVNEDQVIRDEFSDWQLQEIMPSINNKLVGVMAFLNSRNGGLTTYVFKNE